MNFSETNSTMFNFSNKPTQRKEVKLILSGNRIVAMILALILLAAVYSSIGSDNQFTAQSSQATSELKCNSDANRTGYALGCKLTNG
jgi:hypothetical protein